MIGAKRTAMVAALALGLGVLAGCGDDEPRTSTPVAPTTPAGPTVLTVAVYGPAPVVSAYTKIAADFSAANPTIVVNIRPFANAEEAATALAAQRLKGTAPDAFLADLSELPSLMEENAVQPIDRLLGKREVDFGDGFQRDALEAFSADNALQCMPVDASPLVVYFNTALVDLNAAAEIDDTPVTPDDGWTWEQFAAIARAASAERVRGFYLAPQLRQLAPFIWSGGGNLVDDVDDPTTLRLSDADSREALQTVLSLVRDPQATFSAGQIATKPALSRFKAGQLAMMLGYRSLTPALRAQQDLSFGVMPLPRLGRRATAGQTTALCMSAATEHVEATADFMAYAVSNEAMSLLAGTGFVVPTNLEVANGDAFLQPSLSPADAQVFTVGVRSIRRFPTTPTWPIVERKMVPLLRGLFYDPVIDPLPERLQAIDAASAPLFTPIPTPSPSSTPTPSTTPTTSPTAATSP